MLSTRLSLMVALFTLHHSTQAATIPQDFCPESCVCEPETRCTSYEFIKELTPHQVSTIVRLVITNSSLAIIDPKLKYLKNLNYLDLSNNKIVTLPSVFPYLPKLKTINLSGNHFADIQFSKLPKNLETIDLSGNRITNFPKDWASLKSLKTVHLYDNPIDCDCTNLLIYEEILLGGIELARPELLKCGAPNEFLGRTLNSVNCSIVTNNLLNSMLGDEGSGDEPLEHDTNEQSVPVISENEDQFLEVESTTRSEIIDEVEGSGHVEEEEEEGSGAVPLIIVNTEPPKACYFNCSTPNPVGSKDEKNASPAPDLKDSGKMIMEDIFGTDVTTTTTSEPEVFDEEVSGTIEPKEVEPIIIKETDKFEVETFQTNDTVVGEMEKASLQDSSPQVVYIVVGLVIAFAVFMIIYYVNKKRNRQPAANRRRNKSNENGFGEEMKPLGKSAVAQEPILSEKAAVVEEAPLLNGNNAATLPQIISQNGNGKIHDDELSDDDEPVEIRRPTKEQLLTPQVERVTIKVGEIPDSIPRTPMLVHRQVNSDGEIITTAIPNSNH